MKTLFGFAMKFFSTKKIIKSGSNLLNPNIAQINKIKGKIDQMPILNYKKTEKHINDININEDISEKNLNEKYYLKHNQTTLGEEIDEKQESIPKKKRTSGFKVSKNSESFELIKNPAKKSSKKSESHIEEKGLKEIGLQTSQGDNFNLKCSKPTTRKKKAEDDILEKDTKISSHKSQKKNNVNTKIIKNLIKTSEKKEQTNRKQILEDNYEEIKVESKAKLIPKKSKSKSEVKELHNNEYYSNINDKSISFSIVTQELTKIENLKGRNSKDAVKQCFAQLFQDIIIESPDDLVRIYYFLLSKVGPEYKSPELGIGNETLVKCVAKATGKTIKNIKEEMIALGDLALVALKSEIKHPADDEKNIEMINKKQLTLKIVFDGCVQLCNVKGKSSYAEKEKILLNMFYNATNEEIKFIIRSIQKKLKIGASFKTIIAALARCISNIYKDFNLQSLSIEEKEVEIILLLAFNQMADYDIVMKKIHQCIIGKIPFNNLTKLCCITPGIPLKPQLARPTTGLTVIFKRFEDIPFTCEFKYDGFRGQIHHYLCKNTGNYRTEIFSRNLENLTESYPDFVKYVDEKIRSEKIESFIIDCEIVAFHSKTNKIQPFQILTTRARKNVNLEDVSIKVCMFLFDIIYLNGQSVVNETLDKRRKILRETFIESDHIKFAKYINSDQNEEIEALMKDSFENGCEGLIVKALYKNSYYMPGQRNFNWLKLKKDYLETSVGDSLDLVPIGAQYGKGKRTGFYGSFLLACYNEETETYETVSMTGAGLKDEDLERFHKELSQYVIDSPRKDYNISDLEVNVWFNPKIVWEIKTADLSLSPIYTAANNFSSNKKGISLRFPRFIRERTDKKPEGATTSEEIWNMYNNQFINNNKKIDYENEEDFYE